MQKSVCKTICKHESGAPCHLKTCNLNFHNFCALATGSCFWTNCQSALTEECCGLWARKRADDFLFTLYFVKYLALVIYVILSYCLTCSCCPALYFQDGTVILTKKTGGNLVFYRFFKRGADSSRAKTIVKINFLCWSLSMNFMKTFSCVIFWAIRERLFYLLVILAWMKNDSISCIFLLLAEARRGIESCRRRSIELYLQLSCA